MPPPAGGSSRGLPSRVEYPSPPGVLLPRVYGASASPLWLELRGPAAWQPTSCWAVCWLACHRLFPWIRVMSATIPDATWPGSDQWPRGTAPATGPAGQLGRPTASDPWGVVFCALSLCCPRCVRACRARGALAPVHLCVRPVRPVCASRGHVELVSRCARCVPHAGVVGGFVGVPPPPFFLLLLAGCVLVSVFAFFL